MDLRFQTRRSVPLLILAVALAVVITSRAVPSSAGVRLLLYGDDDRRFLGCLNCNEYAADSVHNQYGRYGNPYASYSIWNKYGKYGSPYSNYSVCNPLAMRPPVVLDEDWAFYGRLTLNSLHPEALKEPSVINWLKFVVCGGR